MTNDGAFANMISHPSTHFAKTYRVTVHPKINEDQLTQLTTGVIVDGRKSMPAAIHVVTNEKERTVLEIVLEEGRNRQIRKMCEIANKIKARRLELGLTLEDVAQAVGVGRSTVRKWETGMIKNMGRDKIAALAKVLQISPVELVPAAGSVRSEDEERLEALHQDPRLGLLFDRTRRMSKEDVDFMLQMADRIVKERDGD